jgi:hypothetical protein
VAAVVEAVADARGEEATLLASRIADNAWRAFGLPR